MASHSPILLAAAAIFLVTLASVPTTAQSGRASELPPGEGKDALLRACSDCHGMEVIEGQRRTRRAWQDSVEDMVARGAEASEHDVQLIVAYLTRVLGRVNVNRATTDEIHTIVELPESAAAAVVEYRTREGEFKSLADLKKVPGIDAAAIDAKKDRIVFSGQ